MNEREGNGRGYGRGKGRGRENVIREEVRGMHRSLAHKRKGKDWGK